MAAPIRVTQHPLWAAQAQLRSTLDSLAPDFQTQQPDVLNRARATLDYLTERLEDAAATVISDGALNNGHSWVQTMLNELQGAIAQANPGLIAANTNFYANLEALSQNLPQFPVSHPSGTLSTLAEEAQRRLDAMQALQNKQEAAARAATDQQQAIYAEAQDAKAKGLKRLEEQEAAAGKLLASLGATATSSGYAGTANAEKDQADFWRWVTLGSGVVTALLAIFLFLTIHEEPISSIATRAGVTVPAILLTVYAGKQSSGHRAQQREARRLELAFGVVDSYLSDLNADRRGELKTVLSSRLFGGENSPESAGDYPTSADLVGLLSEAIKRLR